MYARQITELERAGRLTTVKHDASLPVVAALDLGHRDLMPVVCYQNAGTEHRVIWCRSYQFTAIPEMLDDWKSYPFKIDRVILPHDARVRSLTDGKTREEVFISHGYQTDIAAKLSLDEGIEQVRRFIPHLWIDREDAYDVFESLASYRAEFVELAGVFKERPLHDIFSHTADAMRYLATGPHETRAWGPRPRAKLGVI